MGESDEVWRRKLHFRAWHRGTCEADLLMGTFADQHLEGFSDAELRQFESLLDQSDPEIDDWMTGRQPVPREQATRVVALLRRFYAASASGGVSFSATR